MKKYAILVWLTVALPFSARATTEPQVNLPHVDMKSVLSECMDLATGEGFTIRKSSFNEITAERRNGIDVDQWIITLSSSGDGVHVTATIHDIGYSGYSIIQNNWAQLELQRLYSKLEHTSKWAMATQSRKELKTEIAFN